MSVYKNDNPSNFTDAIMSVYKQTLPPNEIVLVIDGPIPQMLKETISKLERQISIMRVITLPQNMGHAIARQTGLSAAKNELCAVMDADDLSVPNRFEKQLQVLKHILRQQW